jgi:type III secretion system YscI/HrpB-like protein
VAKETRGASASDLRLKQLTEMIQLQMEVCRHQVQVELVSKVAESGVATVRKLQQAQ